jgi:hypothetical protein
MKEKLFIFAALLGVIILMVVLNAVSYTQKVKEPDTEMSPNRSTFNPGATGSLALYTLLTETGRPVSRWQLPVSALKAETRNRPSTFVLIGPLRREFSKEETEELLSWVSEGGRLVVIDRMPEKEFLSTSSNWNLEMAPRIDPDLVTIDPANQTQMTADTAAVKPVLPTVYTAAVNAVQPSRFASSIRLMRVKSVEYEQYLENTEESDEDEATDEYYASPTPETSPTPLDFFSGGNDSTAADTQEVYDPPPNAPDTIDDPPVEVEAESSLKDEAAYFKAPVVHIASPDRNVVVDIPYGGGEIVLISDPFIVSNGGIRMADNARLAVNVLSSGQGLIAFDEYHQGFGSGSNRVLEYFEGTPVTAIILQIIAIIAFVLYSRSRRFARPVPEAEPNRLSKLEYVGAMAELQQRTGAYDLAMENIYSDFRRRAARHFAVDNTATTRREMSLMIAGRTNMDPLELEDLMHKCEDITYGEPTNRREMLRLVERLREIEEMLGLARKSRTRI